MSNKSKIRVRPPVFKFTVEAGSIWRPTWMQRLKVFIGYPVKIEYTSFCEHECGKREHYFNATPEKEL